MLAAPNFHKLNIPEFAFGNVVWSKNELTETCNKTESTEVIRYVRLALWSIENSGMGLQEALAATSDTYAQIASLAGVSLYLTNSVLLNTLVIYQ